MRNSARTPNLIKHSPSEDKMSSASPMDDIERGKAPCVCNVPLQEIINKC